MGATFETTSRFLQQLSVPAFPEAHDMLVQEGEPLCIYPDSCGYAWDDEWLNEIFQNPDNLQAESGLAMFFKTIWIATTQFGREDGHHLWNNIQGHFGYPCELPDIGDVTIRDFNWSLVYELLKQDGLGDFRNVINLALCDTGNLFLDASPDDYGYGTVQTPDFTAENIMALRELWREAEKLLAEYETCLLRVSKDPAIYARLAQIWETACRAPLPPDPPKTLEGDHHGNPPSI